MKISNLRRLFNLSESRHLIKDQPYDCCCFWPPIHSTLASTYRLHINDSQKWYRWWKECVCLYVTLLKAATRNAGGQARSGTDQWLADSQYKCQPETSLTLCGKFQLSRVTKGCIKALLLSRQLFSPTVTLLEGNA